MIQVRLLFLRKARQDKPMLKPKLIEMKTQDQKDLIERINTNRKANIPSATQ
jgi:hypothetical protein